MGTNFNRTKYKDRIQELTDRAKADDKSYDLEIGESCYLLSLRAGISLYRMKLISKDELRSLQKNLERQLESYYQHTEIFDMHIDIQDRCSHILTEAEKSGCPICRKLVRVFDGRELSL